jgi:cytochrome P450
MQFIGGKHVGPLEGDEWRRHRKVAIIDTIYPVPRSYINLDLSRFANPAFHRALSVNIFGHLSQKTFSIMQQIGLENLGVTTLCKRMTLDVIGLAGFGFDFEAVSNLDSKWVEGYDTIRFNMAQLFFLLFQVFDDQLKWMCPSRIEAHHQLVILLERIDSMITEKRASITEKINSPDYASMPDAEKDLLTLILEAELQGEGKLSDLELTVSLNTSRITIMAYHSVPLFAEKHRGIFLCWS